MGRKPDITIFVKRSWIFGHLAYLLSTPLLVLSFGNLLALIIQIKAGPSSANFLVHLLSFLVPHSHNIFLAYFAAVFCLLINLIRFGFRVTGRDVSLLIWLLLPLIFVWLRQKLTVGI